MPPRGFREIRQAYLAFFEAKGHKHLPSSGLVPKKDPTVLLTTAGMLQFKPYFMAVEKPPTTRITTVQKCFRTTDLDNVGRTARHHTFFQMLGNFSFGDYFKDEVIPWAWECLTETMGLPKERLWVSVFETDDEAYAIWRDKVGVPEDRIVRMGAEDNFWAAGPTGPCGPCSEIYVDMGVEAGNGNPNARLGEDDDRYLEVWNLVFMEFNRDEKGVLTPLPAKNIDTGMGLERLSAVLQGVKTNFDTDMLRPILDAVATMAGVSYGADAANDLGLRRITDHVRASAFLIADGVVPSNEGRGYVLRRIIRRAYRHGRLMGLTKPFLNELVPLIVSLYGDFYTELAENQKRVQETLLEEEKRFGATIDRGLKLLEEAIVALGEGKTLAGSTAFELYDTYGFPLELTRELVEERGLKVDEAGFEAEMDAQRERARSARDAQGISFSAEVAAKTKSEFWGYDHTEAMSTVVELLPLGGCRLGVVLDHTPFYAESGGQVGDTGHFTLPNAGDPVPVLDTQKRGEANVHVVDEGAPIQVGTALHAVVDAERRDHIRRHHTATHLLHAALKQVLGDQVNQAGSLVGPDMLRFDFSFARAVRKEELAQIEALVNQQTLGNTPVQTDVMAFDEAKNSGAMALFDEKYGDSVRVLSIGAFSKELCGGTHVKATGDIGLVKVRSEGGIAAGVRRIEAVAGAKAYEYVAELASAMGALGDRLKAAPSELPERLDKLQDSLKAKDKEIAALEAKLAAGEADSLKKDAKTVGPFEVLVKKVAFPSKQAMEAVKKLTGDNPNALVALSSPDGFVAASGAQSVSNGLDIGKMFKELGIKGGGRPGMGQGPALASDLMLDEIQNYILKLASKV